MPNNGKDDFINDFWKRRDPIPATEVNEYKLEYYKRINEANRLFRESGKLGWLTDRGRVYVLLGPPTERHVYPTGYSFYDAPSEVWYYNFFPVIFTDNYKIGSFSLTPLGAQYLTELLDSSKYLNQFGKLQNSPLQFSLKILKSKNGVYYIRIILPYKFIFFKKDGDLLSAIIKVKIIVEKNENKIFWKYSNNHKIKFHSKDIKKLKNINVDIKIPLNRGNYKLKATISSDDGILKSNRIFFFKIK
jgi:GWxTD domain-containing protein